MKLLNQQNPLPLVVLWLVQVSFVLFLTAINPNHFTTIDSGFYLQSASMLLQGKGYTYLDQGQLIWNGIFPMGYSAAIAAVSWLSGLPVLWASKAVNLLASGTFLGLLYRWFGTRRAVFSGLILLLGPFLKLWAHTWSEPLFLVLLFGWAYLFFNHPSHYLPLFFLGLSLILVRYAGLFIISLSGLMAIQDFRQMRVNVGKIRLGLTLIWLVFFGSYLVLNFQKSGLWFGGERFSGDVPLSDTFLLFGKGLLNELLLARDSDFTSPDLLFWLALLAQILLFSILINQWRATHFWPKPPQFVSIPAFFYLIFLLILRLISPFDAPGFRLLSPLSFLVYWGIMFKLESFNFTKTSSWAAIGLLLLSWLHILPQTNLNTKLAAGAALLRQILAFH
ncbi:hypothetical protein [Arundinibacter roseus]|uniref:Glycosyltransferase RgtA/B/C/D-like domain-containing protein n=1 Tax=Arundinibacter roseus TaxID=2070510 RepID=A0A4R4K915_9BACT|nr:hypothetical protein [Arundinibacter roseus]TDB64140.1 hypothetical protein EZE20_14465 [Arundinibacter roseus]